MRTVESLDLLKTNYVNITNNTCLNFKYISLSLDKLTLNIYTLEQNILQNSTEGVNTKLADTSGSLAANTTYNKTFLLAASYKGFIQYCMYNPLIFCINITCFTLIFFLKTYISIFSSYKSCLIVN